MPLRLAALLLLATTATWTAGVTAAAAGRVFNVSDFGAVADGRTDDSEAFLRAWTEACATPGRPAVVVPRGDYLLHPLVFRGPCRGYVEVHVGGVLRAPPGLAAFRGCREWVHFSSIDGLLVTGGGTFDGRGATAWPLNECPQKRDCRLLPTSIKLGLVRNATITGVTSLDSKFFHVAVVGSQDVRIHGVSIRAPRSSPNTDGVHIQGSSNVRVTDSAVATGDDCVSVGPGSSDVLVSGVACGPGHGISVGSLGRYPGEGDVRRLRVANCTVAGTSNGVRIKTWRGGSWPPTAVAGLVFEDIVMRKVRNPIIIDQEYCPYPSCRESEQRPSAVRISDVKFRNIRGESATKVAVKLSCSEASPCRELELRDIDLRYVKRGVATQSRCAHVAGGVVGGTLVPPSCI
ncbi:Exopolygalacturonase [Zea mays]|uniref:Exopolygalacturonase n=2 Tax=Zea mays TaxID=4577 RepID=B6UB39_MAIZE|nr:polygalacturonase precursor [Zea mays]ACG46572.1 polygalacturonase precursor [Zea mays]AQK82006.1 Polygalacturonase [Zea mays]PWZ18667.1 Exopolygalacturonase [Zea mays]|eukprot:NP_001152243.1 polygalacturonase precursor [Zea mays]